MRGQRSEVGGQRPEVGGQRPEVGGQNPNERLLRFLQATPEQQAAIDRILEGRLAMEQKAPAPPTGPLLLGMGAGAKLLGVSRATFWRIINAGKLNKVEVLPGSFRVRRADVEALADGHKAEGNPWTTGLRDHGTRGLRTGDN
jgi:hypothetical protein